MKANQKTVPLDEPFEQMMISAERYAFGRRTYIVSKTVGYITPLIHELSDWCLGVLKDDLQSEIDLAERLGNYSNFGHDCDRQNWLAMHKKVCEEIERKKENE